MYEREYLTTEGIQAICVVLGVASAFIMIALFVPEIGILDAGLLTPLTIFFAIGCLCLFAVFKEAKNQIKIRKDRKERVMPSETTIVVQAGTDSSITLIMGAVFSFVGCVFTVVGLFVPGGIMENGLQTGMVAFLCIGGPFALIGFGLLVFGIPEFKTEAIYKKLYKDASMFTTMGTYFELENNQTIDGKPIQDTQYGGKLLYRYQDETGIMRIGETYDSFSKEELAWYKSKGSFKIRCRGKYSVILDYPMLKNDYTGMY